VTFKLLFSIVGSLHLMFGFCAIKTNFPTCITLKLHILELPIFVQAKFSRWTLSLGNYHYKNLGKLMIVDTKKNVVHSKSMQMTKKIK